MGWHCLSIPKLQRCDRWRLGMDKYFHPTFCWSCDYVSMLRLKLNHVSERDPWCIHSMVVIHSCMYRQRYTIYRNIYMLTHWGRLTHICVIKLTIIAADNGLSPGRRQAIMWTNDGILLIWPLGTNFSEILIVIHSFSFKKMLLKMSSWKCGHFVSASMC